MHFLQPRSSGSADRRVGSLTLNSCAARIFPTALVALALAGPLAHAQMRPSQPVAARGTVQIAFTPWDDAEGMIVEAIAGANRQILVQAFSFTSRNIAAALVAARRRGVEVHVLADREQTFSGDNSRIPDLVAAGIAVDLEVRYQSAHNKVMVLDAGSPEATVITGSYNWTYAAQNRNAENVIIFRRHPELVRQYAANWQRHAQDALPYDQAQQ
jgi:phosphatidylserine/phosphatidylglycerophosphate/cardiolipin synthase-like enzyme